MIRYITLLLLVLVVGFTTIKAQTPQGFSYQATVRDGSGNILASQNVYFKFNIMQGSQTALPSYTETHYVPTDDLGQVNLVIGQGSASSGVFSELDWSLGNYFLGIELNTGAGYVAMGTTQLLSVPYALHAKTAETVVGGVSEIDPAFTSSEAANITASDITNLNNLSGVNTGDQDLSGYLTSETDPSVPNGATTGDIQYWNGTAWVTLTPGNDGDVLTLSGGMPTWATGTTTPSTGQDVTNPATGKTWMDRNLGASQVATSSTDAAAYGDLYQWGRGTDGHEKRTSSTEIDLSLENTPGHGRFITIDEAPWQNDWLYSPNSSLWQGVNGMNNPCPSAYRLPTETEWEAERQSWSSNDAAGAYASPLKLPLAGHRGNANAYLLWVGTKGRYYSSSVSSADGYSGYSTFLNFDTSSASVVGGIARANGLSVRCIKD